MTAALDPARILDLRDRGRALSPTARAVLLAGAAPAALGDDARDAVDALDPRDPLDLPIGARDALLYGLRRAWFGERVEALADCAACGLPYELDFDLAAVAAPAAPRDARIEVTAEGRRWRARPPTSRDLLAIEPCATLDAARAALLDRCLETRDAPPGAAAAAAIAAALAARDPQAEVLLTLACPNCGAAGAIGFDIVDQLWAELDRWAEETLDEVDALAHDYGWGERAILALSPARRGAYLDRIAARGGAGS